MDYLLIPDSGFAISIFSLAIMISGLAIMKLVLAQGIFWKDKVKPIMFSFAWICHLPSPAISYSSAFRQSGEIDERQWSYSGIYYTLFIKKEVSYTVFRYQMIQNRAEIKQTFGAVALFVNRNHLVSSGTFYTYYTHARVCEKNMQCTYCTFCTRRAVHYFFCGG